MDITPLFKAYVKSVKSRNKAFGVSNDVNKNRILKTRLKSGFSCSAREVMCQITRLRDFLLESRDPYLSFFNVGGKDEMSESDRDQIENAAQKIINNCSLLVKEFKKDNRKISTSPQTREYMDGVIELIENYLKSVCKIFSELKALRVRRALEIRNLSRLEVPRKKSANEQHDSEENESETVNVINLTQQMDVSEMDSSQTQDLDLSPEELQMFESENIQLYNELNSLSDEVRQIESKVLHIAELQEVFTEKVLQQEQDIDRIANVVVGSTENVTDANEQIKQAIQRNAGLRVWMLFFLLVMSFSLLFLDWYND